MAKGSDSQPQHRRIHQHGTAADTDLVAVHVLAYLRRTGSAACMVRLTRMRSCGCLSGCAHVMCGCETWYKVTGTLMKEPHACTFCTTPHKCLCLCMLRLLPMFRIDALLLRLCLLPTCFLTALQGLVHPASRASLPQPAQFGRAPQNSAGHLMPAATACTPQASPPGGPAVKVEGKTGTGTCRERVLQ